MLEQLDEVETPRKEICKRFKVPESTTLKFLGIIIPNLDNPLFLDKKRRGWDDWTETKKMEEMVDSKMAISPYSPEVVAEAWLKKHQEGKTIEAILSELKKQNEEIVQTVNEQGKILDRTEKTQKDLEDAHQKHTKDYKSLGRIVSV